METSASSSKVTVEYHDPSGVFPLVADEIHKRLPLRNLNWQSPSRPLRQIKTLHVDLVADSATQNNLRPPSARADASAPNSFEIFGARAGTQQGAAKERRHQIPGLKQSPYLKIYVLRCDDNQSYKDSERQRIRDWIRDNASQEGSRDDHDAFKWMILHVVIPDTVAASEPRWRDSTSKELDELRERPKSSAKWPGKSTKTVFDRLRADFNDSGKSGVDRVAQIRLLKSDISPDLLPTPAVAQTLEESSQERENAWNDLITKFRTFILGSFDLRVRQYELDIGEQESRRVLPGWNFCTFFIHKEGLAIALESIGLVEDALAIYDELAIVLETVVHDIASGRAKLTATSFAPYTDDIKERILGAPKVLVNGPPDSSTSISDDDRSNLFEKDYRELIVTSTISAFDFSCYIFSRQKTLVIRLATARSARAQPSNQGKEGGEDLVLTSEACWRTSGFIHVTGRSLRQDLHSQAVTGSDHMSKAEIDGLVRSWVYDVAGRVLKETTTPVMQHLTDPNRPKRESKGGGQRRRLTGTLAVGAEAYPQRSTSLPGLRSNAPELKRPVSRSSTKGTDGFKLQSTSSLDLVKSTGYPGQAELATYRAELFLMRRSMLEKLAAAHGWYAGWASIEHTNPSNMEEIDLNGDASRVATKAQSSVSAHLLSSNLRLALESEESFQRAFLQLTESAIQHYTVATQSKSTQSLMGDVAILKTQQRDYATAVSYFEKIVPSYATQSWNHMASEAFKAYSLCLKNLQRNHEYVKTVLSLLARVCSRELERSVQIPHLNDGKTCPGMTMNVTGMLSDVVAYSEILTHELAVDAENYFTDVNLLGEVRLCPDSDNFSLQLSLRHLLDDHIDVIPSVRLVSVDDPSLEIWLKSETATTLSTGRNVLDVQASTVACGAYLVNKLVMIAQKIRFECDVQPETKSKSLTTAETKKDMTAPLFKVPPCVYVYPSYNAFNATVKQAKDIQIGKARSLDIVLESGRNDVLTIQLKIKPSSAGLRLHIADAACSGIERASRTSVVQGQLSLGQLPPGSSGSISIPYTLEQSVPEISVRLEIHYDTPTGAYQFSGSSLVANSLPLDVDVNDNFHLDVLFSQFTIRAIGHIPLCILEAQLEDSEAFSVRSPPFVPLPATIFHSQPMQLTYQVARQSNAPALHSKPSTALAMKLRYQTIDQIYFEILGNTFAQDLENSPYRHLSRLLNPILLARSKTLVSSADFELAPVLGTIRVPNFETVCWAEVLATLSSAVRVDLSAWLQHWHEKHDELDILRCNTPQTAARTITLSVDVPNVDIIFSYSLDLSEPSKWTHHGAPIVPLGTPIESVVRVKHTRRWTLNVSPVDTFKALSFVCEVHGDADTWLVGGQRRSRFTPKDDSEHSFTVVLIPLQVGSFALPSVEIHLAHPTSDDSSKNEAQPSVSYETHYESAGQRLQIIRDVLTTRVDVVDSQALPTSPTSGAGDTSPRE